MAEEVKNVESTPTVDVEGALKRVHELQSARKSVEDLKNELTTHQKDLTNIETVYGVTSKEYTTKKGLVDLTTAQIADAEKKVEELTFKKSELKPVLDEITKQFDAAFRSQTATDYHIEICEKEKEDGSNKGTAKLGRWVYNQLMDYLGKNVKFTAKTASNLIMLYNDMTENRVWVQSKDFDNVIILKANNVINLWRFITEDMEGKGFREAKPFLQCWAHCGKSVSDAIRTIQKENEKTRQIGTNLNLVDEEMNRSIDDLPQEEAQTTTQEEVAPDVSE